MTWEPAAGVVELPDGARLRGWGRRAGPPAGARADWCLHLVGRPAAVLTTPGRVLRWPDFRLPRDPADARSAFAEAHRRALAGERVAIICAGGVGRTGTALACIAQLAGVPAVSATAWVRARYHPRAVETPWQRRYVRRFGAR